MSDIVIAGNIYQDVPSILIPKDGGGVVQFDDTTIVANAAAAEDIANGKKAFVNGSLITGSASGGTAVWGALRPDAELWKTYTYDKLAVEDEGLTIPAYSTSAMTLKTATNIEQLNVDYNSYHYFVLVRMLSYPIYSTETPQKGRFEWHIMSYYYDVNQFPKNYFSSFSDPSKKYSAALQAGNSCSAYIIGYHASATSFTAARQNYGTYQTPSVTIAATTITVKYPALLLRGSTTYFTSANWSLMTDIRYQSVINVFRAPRDGHGNDGWTTFEQLARDWDCAQTNDRKLL